MSKIMLLTATYAPDGILVLDGMYNLDARASATFIQNSASRKVCKTVGVGYIKTAVQNDPIQFVLQTVEQRRRKSKLAVGFLLAKFANESTLYVDLVCSSKQGGGRILMNAVVDYATKLGKDISLNALPEVIGMYSKFNFQHRLSCAPEADIVLPPANFKKTPLADMYKDKTILRYFMDLTAKGYTTARDCSGTFKSTKEDMAAFVENQCGADGFYMMRCRP